MHVESKNLILALYFFVLFFFNCVIGEIIFYLFIFLVRQNISQNIYSIPSASISALDTTEHISTL